MSSDTPDASEFYDRLAEDYHLIYRDWWRSVERQAEALAKVIESRLGAGPKRILDCTAGIGTQALGLARLGHRVHGTDVSAEAVARATREAEARGVAATFAVHDVRRLDTLDTLEGRAFDVVLSADNSLPHLLELAELRAAAQGMWSQVASPGLLLVGLRDYDRIVRERPTGDAPRLLGEPGQRRVILQLWEWREGEPVYDMHHVIVSERDGGWTTGVRSCAYRAVTRTELAGCFGRAGAAEVEWLEPAESGFFQPLMVAMRGARLPRRAPPQR